jgi:hypothetical protein
MHECPKRDLFDLDTKLMTSVGPVYEQQETSSRYCKLLMLHQSGWPLLFTETIGDEVNDRAII